MSKLELLLAPLLTYPPPEKDDQEELLALVALCRPQFQAIADHLVRLPDVEVKVQCRQLCETLAAHNSPFREMTGNGPIMSTVAYVALSNAITHHAECSPARRHQIFHEMAAANLTEKDRPRPRGPR